MDKQEQLPESRLKRREARDIWLPGIERPRLPKRTEHERTSVVGVRDSAREHEPLLRVLEEAVLPALGKVPRSQPVLFHHLVPSGEEQTTPMTSHPPTSSQSRDRWLPRPDLGHDSGSRRAPLVRATLGIAQGVRYGSKSTKEADQ